MKSEVIVPVVAAVVSAVASIAGVLYSQRSALEVERLKWEQTQREDLRKSEMQALADFARELATAYQRSEYIIWRAEVMPDSLRADDFSAYQKETKENFPKLVAAQILMATHNKAIHEELAGSLAEYRALDERITVAGKRFQKNRQLAVNDLAKEAGKIQRFENDLIKSLEKARSQVSQRSGGN